jgi:uncharacterized protein involved in outer membrane biogenesis
MKRWVLRIVFCLCGVLVLVIAAGLFAKSLVSGSAKDSLVASLGQQLGVPLSVGTAAFDLGEFVRLRPAVSLDNITIGNPAGFRVAHMIEARTMYAQVRLLPLFKRRIEVHSLVIEQPRVLVESNAQGVTNLEAFVKGLGSQKPPAAAAPRGGGGNSRELAVEDLRIESGAILLGGKAIAEDLNLRVRDFSADRSARIELGARLFGGANSRLDMDGHAGPFGSGALPLDGTLRLLIAPAEIPARLRQEQFGKLLGAPGPKSRASLQGTIKGDIYGTVGGPAKLTFSEIMIGKDDKHALPLAGEVPISFTASKLMSAPSFALKIPKGRLQLGAGEWSGNAEFRIRGPVLSGSSRGSIRNVDINQLASGFTTADGKIYGIAEIPSYSVQFSGRNADEIRDSATGSGKLSVSKGRIAALDMLGSIQRALQQTQETAPGETPFTNLATDLNIGGKRLDLSGVLLDSPVLRLTGSGAIGFDQALNFDLQARVTGAPARLVNRLTRSDQTDEALVPVKVAGTVNSPQVRPDVKELATGAVEGLFKSLLKPRK